MTLEHSIRQELVESFGYQLDEEGLGADMMKRLSAHSANTSVMSKGPDFTKAVKAGNTKLLTRLATVFGLYELWVPAQNAIINIQNRLDKNEISEEQAIKEMDITVAQFSARVLSTLITSGLLFRVLPIVARIATPIPFFGPIFAGLSLIAMTPAARTYISTWVNSNGSWLSKIIATYLLSHVIPPDSKIIASAASLAAEGTKKFGEFSDQMLSDVGSSVLHRHSDTPADTTTAPSNSQDDYINPASVGGAQTPSINQKIDKIREKLISLGEKIPATGAPDEEFYAAYHRHRNDVKGIQESGESIRELSLKLQILEDAKSDAEAGAKEFMQDFPDLVQIIQQRMTQNAPAQGGTPTPAQQDIPAQGGTSAPAVSTTAGPLGAQASAGGLNVSAGPQGSNFDASGHITGMPPTTLNGPNQELLNKAAELTKAGNTEKAKIYTDVYARQVAQQKAAKPTSENTELNRIITLAKNK